MARLTCWLTRVTVSQKLPQSDDPEASLDHPRGWDGCQAICIPTPLLSWMLWTSSLSWALSWADPGAMALVLLAGTPCWACPCHCCGPLGEWELSMDTHFIVSICYYCMKHLLPLQSAAWKVHKKLPSITSYLVSAEARRAQAAIKHCKCLPVFLPKFFGIFKFSLGNNKSPYCSKYLTFLASCHSPTVA